MQASREPPIHFKELMPTNTFKKKFSVLVLDVRRFLEWMIKLCNSSANSIYEIIEKKGNSFSKRFEKSLFPKIPDPVLKGIGTRQVRQILQESLFQQTYGHNY